MHKIDSRCREATLGPDDPNCAAFNAAFDELDLDWHWDAALYRSLPHDGDDRAMLCAYLREHRSHVLKAYDLAFLCDVILSAKRRYQAGSVPATS